MRRLPPPACRDEVPGRCRVGAGLLYCRRGSPSQPRRAQVSTGFSTGSEGGGVVRDRRAGGAGKVEVAACDRGM